MIAKENRELTHDDDEEALQISRLDGLMMECAISTGLDDDNMKKSDRYRALLTAQSGACILRDAVRYREGRAIHPLFALIATFRSMNTAR